MIDHVCVSKVWSIFNLYAKVENCKLIDFINNNDFDKNIEWKHLVKDDNVMFFFILSLS